MTTLGDVLGILHRGGASGRLDLAGDRSEVHNVFLSDGGVVAVQLGRAATSLYTVLREQGDVDYHVLQRSLLVALASRRLHGEVLVREFRISKDVIDRAVRLQLRDRITWLETLADAALTFHVAIRPPRGALLDAPMSKEEFLQGRTRARSTRERHPAQRSVHRARFDTPSPRTQALAALGLDDTAQPPEIRAKYREIIKSCHPDLHANSDPRDQKSRSERLQKVTEAYRKLSA